MVRFINNNYLGKTKNAHATHVLARLALVVVGHVVIKTHKIPRMREVLSRKSMLIIPKP